MLKERSIWSLKPQISELTELLEIGRGRKDIHSSTLSRVQPPDCERVNFYCFINKLPFS